MADPPTIPSSRQQSVLIVDDEADLGGTLALALARQLKGVKIEVVTSPAAALERLAAAPVDIVISDFRMPGMTGLDFLARVRERAPSTSCMMMTGYAEERLVIDAIQRVGLEHFFQKPFRLDDAANVVRRSLEKRRADADRVLSLARSMAAARNVPG